MEYLALFGLVIALALLWYLKKGDTGGSMSVLSKYSRDLTKIARDKKLDPVIGREHEIAKVIQILSRRNKNNPVLIGKAGVGKTAIAEGLAAAIVSKKVPSSLYNKIVLALDLPGILAGTKYRGEFEQRLKKITDEILTYQRVIILFIDEIHILAEAGEAEGAINAADILKPLLARGELQVVGATTKDEYEKYIKADATLARRLQPVFVAEPTKEQTQQILNGIKKVYESYHHVTILPAAISAAISATEHIKSRSYPDKAIDAIDEASSKVNIDKLQPKGYKKKEAIVTAQDVKSVVTSWKEI